MTGFNHSREAEKAVLGSMILTDKACAQVSWLDTEKFYIPAHQSIHSTLVDLHAKGAPIDLVTVRDELNERGKLESVGGIDYVIEVMESVPTADNAKYYANIVRDKWVIRELHDRLDNSLKALEDPSLETAEKVESASTLVQGLLDSTTYEFTVEDVYTGLTDKIQPGLATGIGPVDEYSNCGGFYPGWPNIFAAPTGVGKTLLCAQVTKKWCNDKKRVLFISLEMTSQQLVRRLMKSICGFDSQSEAREQNMEEEWLLAAREMLDWDLVIYDPSKTVGGSKDVETICEWVTAKHEHQPADAIIVDYVQICRTRQPHKGKTERMEIVEEALTALAKKCGFVMVLAAQLIKYDNRYQIRNSQEFGLGAGFRLDLTYIEEENRYKLYCAKNRNGRSNWPHKMILDKTHLTFDSDPMEGMR